MFFYVLIAVILTTFPLSFSPEMGSGKQCLCSSVRRLDTSDVKDVQIYPATIFCDNVEIV